MSFGCSSFFRLSSFGCDAVPQAKAERALQKARDLADAKAAKEAERDAAKQRKQRDRQHAQEARAAAAAAKKAAASEQAAAVAVARAEKDRATAATADAKQQQTQRLAKQGDGSGGGFESAPVAGLGPVPGRPARPTSVEFFVESHGAAVGGGGPATRGGLFAGEQKAAWEEEELGAAWEEKEAGRQRKDTGLGGSV